MFGADGPEANSHLPDTEQEIRPLLVKGRKGVQDDDDTGTPVSMLKGWPELYNFFF